jgi:heme/copper-type cytochrome/quinol oxidase subunit 3
VTSVVVKGPPTEHVESLDVVGSRWRTGVRLLIAADAALLVALVFTYFYLRALNTDGGWIPKGSPTEAIWISWALAGGMVLSAALYRWGERSNLAGRTNRLVLGSGLAVLVLVLTTVGQITQMATFPFKAEVGAYASTLWVLAGTNLFHLLLTLFIGVGLWNRSRMGKYTKTDAWQVRVVGLWWSWVALSTIIGAFSASFVASPHP